MQTNILAFIIIPILFEQYDLVSGKALVGLNVRTADENELKFVVGIAEVDDSVRIEENIICSGALLTKSHVLTCEHCFEDSQIKLQIMIGSNNLRESRPYTPLYWITFDQWAATSNVEIEYPENDIAIIKLVEAVPDGYSKASLGTFVENSDLYGLSTVIAGWGVIKNNTVPIKLQKAVLRVIPNEQCEMILENLTGEDHPVPEQLYICTKTLPYTHLGTGDSGGPLLHNNKLIAINKALCPDIAFSAHQVNAHLSINYYRNFISANINT